MKKRVLSIIGIMAIMMAMIQFSFSSKAEPEDNTYYMGEVQQKDDAGYGKNKKMSKKDVHYGWDLGRFKITGYTRQTTDADGKIVFLKNVGDEINLSFELDQDITKLNGKKSLVISKDKNGYDDYFGISKNERTNFGKGALVVKMTDYQNNVTYVEPYVDYLVGIDKGANTDIKTFEEGDYEIALDYEIRKKIKVFSDKYTHYQIKIEFSVRNGNCMVFPFDIKTKKELVNTSFTENGFYLDLAKSRYLTIDVKKLNYVESDGSLVEDTRFNKPAADGEEFTDEGVYIITVRNLYTNAETEKKIYVGDNPILKAYVTTGKDIDYIKELVDEGATIDDDGEIILPVEDDKVDVEESGDAVSENVISDNEIDVTSVESKSSDASKIEKDKPSNSNINLNKYIVIASLLIVVACFIINVSTRRKLAAYKAESNSKTSQEQEVSKEKEETKDSDGSEENHNIKED